MRKVILSIIILLPLLGCKKKITQFYVDYTSTVVIQSSVTQLLPFNVYTPDVTTNSEFEFSANNTNADRINSIYLRDMTLTITSPAGEDFSFLNSVDIFISSPNHTERKAAFKESIGSSPGNQLVCDIVDVDLQDFIKDEKFTIRVETVTDEALADDVHIDLYTRFLVDAKLIK
ncbi:MAG: hypothetical protein ACJASQ_002066 [Crocinitomicaceae bacterium]|jgi:hypothetical protein